jgi:predicted AAA+ superfamily ATPase
VKPVDFFCLAPLQPDLLKNSSETLAGRISYLELHPLQFDEVRDK